MMSLSTITSRQQTHHAQAKPANLTPVGDEANKRGDDFYDGKEHTYSVANTKHKKKAKTESAAGGGEWEGPPVYDMAVPRETSWGVTEEYSNLKY